MSNDLFASGDTNLRSPVWSVSKRLREVTGWTVLGLMVAFFAVVIGVNAFMAHKALSTFGGVETDSSYRAGQTFERDVAMARAQDAQHWQVDAKVTALANGTALLDIGARDASGAPLTGMVAMALFARPTDRRLDREVAVSEDAPGHFHGSAILPPDNGIWSSSFRARARGCSAPRIAF
jgi:nitrogen fixation protein FixH